MNSRTEPIQMKQPIAGVAPAAINEVTNMIVWPSISATWRGQLLGRIYQIRFGQAVLPFSLTGGRLLAFASIPLVLPLIFGPLGAELASAFLRWLGSLAKPLQSPLEGLARLNDKVAEAIVGPALRYRLTNRRVIVERPLQKIEERSVALDRFDSIEVQVQPGQEWYKAGDLIFRRGSVETFRLQGIPRPETFRHTCLKSQQSYVAIQKCQKRGVAV